MCQLNARTTNKATTMRLRLLCLVLLALVGGAGARVIETGNANDRSALRSLPAALAAGGAGKAAASLRASAGSRAGPSSPFEPPRREERDDVSDHEAADVCMAFAAGACSCM